MPTNHELSIICTSIFRASSAASNKMINDTCSQRAGTVHRKGCFHLKCKSGALKQNMTKVLTYNKIRLEVLVKLPFAFLSSNLFLTKGKENLCQQCSNMLVANKELFQKASLPAESLSSERHLVITSSILK